MANEITLSSALSYLNPAAGVLAAVGFTYGPASASIVGKNYTSSIWTVPTTATGTAIPLGSLASIGWALFVNRDATNYIELMTAVSGTKIIKLEPGECALFRFDPAITAPAALSNTAACQLQQIILEN